MVIHLSGFYSIKHDLERKKEKKQQEHKQITKKKEPKYKGTTYVCRT